MIALIKQWVSGTPLEGLARVVYHAVRPTPIDLGRLYDEQTVAVMERVLESDSNCIDVGCHEGSILDVMLRLAPAGQHHAFEPLPHLYAALLHKYGGMSNVHIYEAALSDAPGTATFQHVTTNPAYSGLLKRRYDRPHEDVVEINVNLLKLDDVLPPDLDVRLVKIDVEGAELQVLRGAMATLRRCQPYVVFEHGLGGADCYGTRPEQVFDLFTECSLRISIMKEWLNSGSAKPLSRKGFAAQFDRGRNYYFMAHP